MFCEALVTKDEIKQPLRNMSLGQRTKMELIFSFLHLPRIVYLDEPTSGLDIISRRSLREFINYCHTVLGICFIISSHNIEDLSDCCQTCLILNEGGVLYNGEIKYLFDYWRKDLIIFEGLSEDDAYAINQKYNGKIDGDCCTIEVEKQSFSKVLSDILQNHTVPGFHLKQETTESIVAHILEDKKCIIQD